MIEELLKKLAKDGSLLVLMKANNGYSAVVLPHSHYRDIIMELHHNGFTVEEAVKKLIEHEE